MTFGMTFTKYNFWLFWTAGGGFIVTNNKTII